MSIDVNSLVDYLYKKALGAPQTDPNRNINVEPSFSSIPSIFQSQNYAQHIPKPAPTDWIPANSNIQYSAQYPYIYKYTQLALCNAVDGSLNTAFRHPAMINIIPKSYDTSYAPTICNASQLQNITDRPLILDPDSGILLFIPRNTIIATSESPPKITFYSYTGLIGNPGIASLQEL
jgi:hypothetical protein